jgi:hypothetical protein
MPQRFVFLQVDLVSAVWKGNHYMGKIFRPKLIFKIASWGRAKKLTLKYFLISEKKPLPFLKKYLT